MGAGDGFAEGGGQEEYVMVCVDLGRCGRKEWDDWGWLLAGD